MHGLPERNLGMGFLKAAKNCGLLRVSIKPQTVKMQFLAVWGIFLEWKLF